MYLITTLAILFLVGEVVLRYQSKQNNILKFELKDYPYYKYKPNSKGRQPWFFNRLGKDLTPEIVVSSLGIRKYNTETDKKRVLQLGCSFTEGGGLPFEKTYPGVLQSFLGDSYTAINAGISGYGIFQIKQLLFELIELTSPSIVTIQLLDFRRIPLDQQKLAHAKKVLLRMEKIKSISHFFAYIYKKFLKNKDYLSEPYYYHNIGMTNDEAWEKNKQYLKEIVTLCKERNTPLILFQWPGLTFFADKLKDFSKFHSVYFCETNSIYRYYKLNELQLHKNDSHPNELANRLVAKSIFKTLREQNLIVK